MAQVPVCLSIAGSDPSGGAGIQADLKTFAALNVFGCAALTALTAQNTTGVQDVFRLTPEFVAKQARSVFDDLPVAAVKTGMLATAPIIGAVCDVLEERLEFEPGLIIVVDPVMVARSGDPLLDPKAELVLRDRLFPLATIVTPNRFEACRLTATPPIDDVESLRCTALAMFRLCGERPVLIKGGSALTGALDLLIDGHGEEFPLAIAGGPIASRSTHGTGCTLSAALAALLARGLSLREAAAGAKQYVFGAIEHAPGLGRGNGPLDHGWLRRIGPDTRVRDDEAHGSDSDVRSPW
jgi:hydroxymethylpyrimidine/phosphomethylpyrimidine kinase